MAAGLAFGFGASIAADAIGAGVSTAIECIFGWDAGIVRTLLKNAIIGVLLAITFGSVGQYLEGSGLSEVAAGGVEGIASYLADQTINAATS